MSHLDAMREITDVIRDAFTYRPDPAQVFARRVADAVDDIISIHAENYPAGAKRQEFILAVSQSLEKAYHEQLKADAGVRKAKEEGAVK